MEKYVFKTVDDITDPILKMKVKKGEMTLKAAQDTANLRAGFSAVQLGII